MADEKPFSDTCLICGRNKHISGCLKDELENRLRWLNYEKDMIEEEGTALELFSINKKIIKIRKELIMIDKIFR